MSAFTSNTVLIQVRHRITHEFLAEGVITPGDLISIDPTAGDVIRNATAADDNPHLMIAIEDALRGRGISDNYADNDLVACYVPLPGDILFMNVADGETPAYGEYLESASAGALQAATTGAPVAVALEAFTASGVTRIKCMWMPSGIPTPA